MVFRRVTEGVYVVPMGKANAFLIEARDGMALHDAGLPGKEAEVFRAICELGRTPEQLTLLIPTHTRPIMSAAAAAVMQGLGTRRWLNDICFQPVPVARMGQRDSLRLLETWCEPWI